MNLSGCLTQSNSEIYGVKMARYATLIRVTTKRDSSSKSIMGDRVVVLSLSNTAEVTGLRDALDSYLKENGKAEEFSHLVVPLGQYEIDIGKTAIDEDLLSLTSTVAKIPIQPPDDIGKDIPPIG